MRNYIEELKGSGLTYKELARETGIAVKTLQGLKSGRIKLQGGGAGSMYENIRNANRRLGYKKARQAGMSPERASSARRTILNPKRVTDVRRSTREVKHLQDTTRFQTRILGEFYHAKRKETRIQEGFSHAYLTPKDHVEHHASQTEEAIADAIIKLGGTGWELVRLIEHEVIKYKISKKRT